MYYHFKPRTTDQPTSCWLWNPQARFLPLSIRDTFSSMRRTWAPFANIGSLGKPWPRALIATNVTKAEPGYSMWAVFAGSWKSRLTPEFLFNPPPPPLAVPVPFRLCSSSRTNAVPGPYPLANPLFPHCKRHLPEITLMRFLAVKLLGAGFLGRAGRHKSAGKKKRI